MPYGLMRGLVLDAVSCESGFSMEILEARWFSLVIY